MKTRLSALALVLGLAVLPAQVSAQANTRRDHHHDEAPPIRLEREAGGGPRALNVNDRSR